MEKTAKFWINCVYLVYVYLILHGTMKMSNTQLFSYLLCQFSALQIAKMLGINEFARRKPKFDRGTT